MFLIQIVPILIEVIIIIIIIISDNYTGIIILYHSRNNEGQNPK